MNERDLTVSVSLYKSCCIDRFLLLSAYNGHVKTRCWAFSKPPHWHEGLLTIFFRYKSGFKALHSIRSLAWRTWPSREPTLKYFGGFGRFLFNWNLNAETEVDSLISFGRLFHALIVERKPSNLKFVPEFLGTRTMWKWIQERYVCTERS